MMVPEVNCNNFTYTCVQCYRLIYCLWIWSYSDCIFIFEMCISSVCICVYLWVCVRVCVYVCAWNLCYRVYVCEDKHFTKVHSSTTLSYTYVRKELCNEQLIYDDCSTKHFDLHPWHVVQGNLAETRNTGTTHNNTFTTPTIISRSQNHKRSRFAVDPQLHYVHAIILPYHQKGF